MRKFALIFLCVAAPAFARTVVVDQNGLRDYTTIQSAINDANNGDIILINPGTYTGDGNRDIDFLGKAITVRGSTDDPNDSVIDCNGTIVEPHRGFKFIFYESLNSILEFVTITNGYGSGSEGGGGAIRIFKASPTIKNCIITGNSAYYYGGGIYEYAGNPLIQNCIFSNNSAVLGGGISCYSNYFLQPGIIQNCIFKNNSAALGGGIYLNYNQVIQNCVIINNTSSESKGGGLYNESPYSTIKNCTIVSNNGKGVYNNNGYPTIINSIIWNNGGGQLYGSNYTVSCSDIQLGYSGIGNINSDPLFSPDGFHLSAASPCFDAGDPNYIPDVNETDIDGDSRVLFRIDMGADELFSSDSK